MTTLNKQELAYVIRGLLEQHVKALESHFTNVHSVEITQPEPLVLQLRVDCRPGSIRYFNLKLSEPIG